MAKKEVVICTNVFKNKDEPTIRVELTKMWIELINYIESCKSNA